MPPVKPLSKMTLAVLLWLPFTFAGWYFMAIVFATPVAWLSEWLLTGLFPDTLQGVEQSGYLLDMVTRVAPVGVSPQDGKVAELLITVNPLIYGYGVPLYTAFVLAVADEEGSHWRNWILGFAVLLLVQTFGVSMETLKVIVFELGPAGRQALDLSSWELELVALGYQMGSLILPAVTPVVLWLGFYRRYLETLAPQFARTRSDAPR